MSGLFSMEQAAVLTPLRPDADRRNGLTMRHLDAGWG
jgi:hypothetical protein